MEFNAATYPPARRSDHQDLYFGTAVADPYRWMEDLDSPEIKSWVTAENALTEAFLAEAPQRAAIHARLLALNNYERFSIPRREAGRLFFSRNSGLQNQAVLYWQPGEDAEPAVLLNPNTLAADATISLSSYSISQDGQWMAYALAEAGSDVLHARVREVATGQDLPDIVDWIKFSGLSWAHDGSGFYYSSFGPPASDAERDELLKRVNTHHKLYFHKLGTSQSDDPIVYDRPDDREMLVSGGVSDDGRWLVLSAGKGHHNTLCVRDLQAPGAPDIVLAAHDDAIYSFLGNVGSTAFVSTNVDAPKSYVAAVDLTRSERTAWRTIIPERDQPLESAVLVGNSLVLTYLQDARSQVEQRTLDGSLLRTIDLPGIGQAGVAGGRLEDRETYFVFTNYTTPPTPYKLDLVSGQASIWKQPDLQFDPSSYETTLEFATSKDGTQVPLFVTRAKTIILDGSAPAILYGYGGFGVSLGPAFSSSRMAWLEMGGVYAEAILRGGGEYGEDWHQAGTKTRKQNVFDDFIACAELLLETKYTAPKRLAINGGSNGGLLCGAVELQRPELFGAVLAQVGVMDMLRFDQFTIGYAWKPDYGSPQESEEEFQALLKYSPLHNIREGVTYPPTLILTADHDDRVYPAHSFKFAAAMQHAAALTPGAAPVFIRIEERAGHGAGTPLSKQLQVTADMYAFLTHVLTGFPAQAAQ